MFRKPGILFVCAATLAFILSASAGAEAPPAAAQRQEGEKAAEQKLKALDKSMEELAAESRKNESGPRAEMNRLYEEFKKKQRNAGKDLEELRQSTNETWDKAKVRMDKALEDLNGLYDRAKAKVKGKDKEESREPAGHGPL